MSDRNLTRSSVVCCALTIATAGCIPSFFGLYSDEDLRFDKRLVGDWVCPDEPEDIWKFEAVGQESYRVSYRPLYDSLPNEANRLGKVGRFEVHLVELGEEMYLDFYPTDLELSNSLLEAHLMPVHLFAKVVVEESSIRFAFLDWQWFQRALDEDRVELPMVESEDATLITATTEELQAFVQRISEDPKAFPVENECRLERRRTAVGFG